MVHVERAGQHPTARCGVVQLPGGRQPALRPPPARDAPNQQPRRLRLGRGGRGDPDRVQHLGQAAPGPPILTEGEPGGLGEVQVHVHKPGQDMAAGEVDDLVGRGRRLGWLAEGGHVVVLDE